MGHLDVLDGFVELERFGHTPFRVGVHHHLLLVLREHRSRIGIVVEQPVVHEVHPRDKGKLEPESGVKVDHNRITKPDFDGVLRLVHHKGGEVKHGRGNEAECEDSVDGTGAESFQKLHGIAKWSVSGWS